MTPLWNLEKMWQHAKSARAGSGSLQDLDGRSKAEAGRELLKRCQDRDAELEQSALEAERAGDHEAAWFAMATRAENRRFMQKLFKELAPKPSGSSPIGAICGVDEVKE
jgi:hypothetical protein